MIDSCRFWWDFFWTKKKLQKRFRETKACWVSADLFDKEINLLALFIVDPWGFDENKNILRNILLPTTPLSILEEYRSMFNDDEVKFGKYVCARVCNGVDDRQDMTFDSRTYRGCSDLFAKNCYDFVNRCVDDLCENFMTVQEKVFLGISIISVILYSGALSPIQ